MAPPSMEATSMTHPPCTIFTDALPDLCFGSAHEQVERLEENSLIDIFVSRKNSTLLPASPEEEQEVLRGIIEIVKPHFSRCRQIVFDVAYTASLPRITIDFPYVLPNLEKLTLRAANDNGMYEFVDRSLPRDVDVSLSTGVPFPLGIKDLELDGYNFIDIAMKNEKQYELNNPEGRPHFKFNKLTISHYNPTNCIQFVVEYPMRLLLDHVVNLDLKDLDFDVDWENINLKAKPNSHDLDCPISTSLTGVGPNLTALIFLNRQFHKAAIHGCGLSRLAQMGPGFKLNVVELEISDIGTACAPDLRTLLTIWDGYFLRVVDCQGFDNDVLQALGDGIRADPDSDVTMPCDSMQALSIKNCHNFTIDSLLSMLGSRTTDNLSLDNVPDLNPEERRLLARYFQMPFDGMEVDIMQAGSMCWIRES
ncbi:hypothetical protein H0H92_008265 [Tricholoma furcatifolium]|nr:hypothetical protein H0H92_008265 [Tricholoma furcatifolium]